MSTQPSNLKDPIFDLRQSFNQAAKAGNVEQIVSLATDDVVCMPPNDTTLYGKDELRAWFEEYFQYFQLVAVTEPDRDVVVNGDWALEISSYMIAIVPVSGGTRIRDDGRLFSIWKRQPDSSWKIWQTMWNSIKPVGSGTNRYLARLMQKKGGKTNE